MQIVEYLKDVRGELRHVKWPTKKTTITFSMIVVAMSIVTAAYLGAFDFLFSEIIKSVI